MSKLWRFEAVGPRTVIDPAGAIAAEVDPPLGLATSVFDVEGDGQLRRLEILLDNPANGAALAADLALPETGVSITVEPMADENWVEKSLQGLAPVHAGRFFVRGGHSAPAPGGVIDIRIEAGEAFGTGHHGTTAGCLAALDRVLKRGAPGRVLDLGTGTGVLAIAAAKAAHVPVDATDIDPLAVAFAGKAACDNGVSGLVTIRRSSDISVFDGRSYDLILANILAGPLIALARPIAAAAAPGAQVILSGLLEPQSRSVTAAYRNAGLVFQRRGVREGWVTLTMKRPD